MRHLLLIVVLGGSGVARGDVTNRDFLPFGERAAMLGNAGLCSPDSEAVFYNPANLARLDHPTTTTVGTTYLKYSVSADPAFVITGEPRGFTSAGFIPIPSTVISVRTVGKWRLATAILVPEAIDFKKRSSFNTATAAVTLLRQASVESLWIGGSLARAIAPNLSVGLSVFGSRDKQAGFSVVRIATMTDAQETLSNEDTQVFNVSAIGGVYWEPSPAVGLALRVHSPTLRLGGTSELYASQVQVGSNPGAVEQSVSARASRPLPTDLGFGIAVRPSRSIEIVADVGLQLPATIVQLDDPVAGRRAFDVHLAPRVGVGIDAALTSHAWLRLGASYNRSALDAPKLPGDESRDNYYGITGGFAFRKERTQTSFGMFALRGTSQQFVALADPAERVDAKILLYGAMLTFSYRL
jgi:hypothetical protein